MIRPLRKTPIFVKSAFSVFYLISTVLCASKCCAVEKINPDYELILSVDTCPPNINLEYGNFINWESNTGKVTLGTAPSNIITWDNPTWLSNTGLPIRHEIIDRNNASPSIDYWGNFPVNPPYGGGRYAMRLGSDKNDPLSLSPLPNALSDGIRYKISVPTNIENFGIIYSYAVVFENPNHPDNIHSYEEQPRFIARFYEPGGDTLSCANFTYVASDPLPGFDTSARFKIDSASGRYPGGINFALVKFKTWSSVFINLNKFKGKTLFVEFTTTDCTKRGHFGYAYVDVLECAAPVTAEISCSGSAINSVTLTAPPGFKNYEWWNFNYSKKLGSGDTLKVSGIKENEKVNLEVTPFDRFGCKDTLSTLVKVKSSSIPGIRYPTVYTGMNMNTQLKARGIGSLYQWLPQSGLNDNNRIDPVFNFNKDVEYLIRILNTNGCQTIDTLNVLIEDEADILVPDAFSPNGDGRNDKLEFFLRGIKSIHFWVFNRWGQLMFETTNPSQKWDGIFNGKPQPLETYVWIAEGTTYTGRVIRKRGQTVLIR